MKEYILIPKEDWEYIKNCIEYDNLRPDPRASYTRVINKWWKLVNKEYKTVKK